MQIRMDLSHLKSLQYFMRGFAGHALVVAHKEIAHEEIAQIAHEEEEIAHEEEIAQIAHEEIAHQVTEMVTKKMHLKDLARTKRTIQKARQAEAIESVINEQTIYDGIPTTL